MDKPVSVTVIIIPVVAFEIVLRSFTTSSNASRDNCESKTFSQINKVCPGISLPASYNVKLFELVKFAFYF